MQKTKKAVITVTKKEEKNGHHMEVDIDGKVDKDMTRFVIERLYGELRVDPIVRWWEFWR